MNEPVIDDSALLHRQAYDPIKAREYYLRTRHLKGRRHGVVAQPVGQTHVIKAAPGHLRPSRRAHLEAEKAALEKRLDTLKNVLEELVAAAKRRSGVKTKPKKQTPAEKAKTEATQKKQDKNSKPLTAAEKAKKREDSKKAYQKENGTNLAQSVEELHKQVADIRAKIEKAMVEARKDVDRHTRIVTTTSPRRQSAQSKPQTASKGR